VVSALTLATSIGVAGCTSSDSPAAPSTAVTTSTVTRTPVPTPTNPIDAGPTTVAEAPACPWLDTTVTAHRLGMRLGRITVLRSGAHVVGCRIYALQNSPLATSEHLPPANQPVIELTSRRYASALGAHNAFVREARKGTAPQQVAIGSTTGVCFQTDFYAKDKGTDWACAWNVGATAISLRTVTDTSYSAIQVALAVELPAY
jgi:hypothetical protein